MENLTPLRGAEHEPPQRWDLGARPVDGEGPLPRFQPTQSGCANGGGLLKGGEKESRAANARVAATLAKGARGAGPRPARRRRPYAARGIRPRLHTRHHRVPDADIFFFVAVARHNKAAWVTVQIWR